MLFERNDEDPTMVATTLTQVLAHNISMLNEKVMEVELENQKLNGELISLREEMKKMRKVDDHIVSLKEKILEKQEKPHDVTVECFTEAQKMANKIKSSKKNIDIASLIN